MFLAIPATFSLRVAAAVHAFGPGGPSSAVEAKRLGRNTPDRRSGVWPWRARRTAVVELGSATTALDRFLTFRDPAGARTVDADAAPLKQSLPSESLPAETLVGVADRLLSISQLLHGAGNDPGFHAWRQNAPPGLMTQLLRQETSNRRVLYVASQLNGYLEPADALAHSALPGPLMQIRFAAPRN